MNIQLIRKEVEAICERRIQKLLPALNTPGRRKADSLLMGIYLLRDKWVNTRYLELRQSLIEAEAEFSGMEVSNE